MHSNPERPLAKTSSHQPTRAMKRSDRMKYAFKAGQEQFSFYGSVAINIATAARIALRNDIPLDKQNCGTNLVDLGRSTRWGHRRWHNEPVVLPIVRHRQHQSCCPKRHRQHRRHGELASSRHHPRNNYWFISSMPVRRMVVLVQRPVIVPILMPMMMRMQITIIMSVQMRMP